jgi:hypothetical protein
MNSDTVFYRVYYSHLRSLDLITSLAEFTLHFEVNA